MVRKAIFRMKSYAILGDPLQILGVRGRENNQTIAMDPGCGAKTIWVSKYGSGKANKNQDKEEKGGNSTLFILHNTSFFSSQPP